MPDFINAHGHYYELFSRGLALKDSPASNFIEILERLWWKFDNPLFA
jgi:cytosine/adenosine deaminase-related metal-dependent hydrolase